MASTTHVTMIDDLDGRKAEETVSFGLDGARYEMDLSKRNAAILRKVFAEFVGVSRQIQPRRLAKTSARRGAVIRNKATRTEVAAIREWAAAAGMQVAPRGRIAAVVLESYSQSRQNVSEKSR